MTDKPWLKSYEPHVPEHLDYPATVLPDVLRRVARDRAYRTAMIFKGTRLTYGEFDRAVDRLAAALQRLGVQPGDRVAVHLPNCPQFVIAYYAILRLGAVVVPCNPIYQQHEMVHQLNDAGAQVIVTLSSTYPLIKRIRSDTPLRHVIVAQIKTYFPPALRTAFTLFMEKPRGHRVELKDDADTHWFTDVLRHAPGRYQPAEVKPDDLAVLMYTGGTTGVSKGAMLTHRNILANAYQCKVWLNAPEAQDIGLAQLPLFHAYGMTTGLNLSVITANTMILVPDPRDIDDVLHTIMRYRPTLYPGVPAMYTAINNVPDIQKYNLKSIRLCISGAAGLPVDVQQRFQELTGARLVEGYGLSEASPVVCANPLFGENRLGTIGLPWPDTEVKIVDADDGERQLGVGEVGELCVRGPQVMQGYWNRPEETAETLIDGWLRTGDIAVMDEQGYFAIVDRKKDMILSAGYNVYPREVEEVLHQHPKVQEAAVIGLPDGMRGEKITAYIKLVPGQTATAADIRKFCRDRLAPYKQPRSVIFQADLPKNMAGKILRRQLKEEALARLKEKPTPEEPEM